LNFGQVSILIYLLLTCSLPFQSLKGNPKARRLNTPPSKAGFPHQATIQTRLNRIETTLLKKNKL